ncbi:sigma-70 family RNA polymerase sigma factor [Actinomarinicola tropica]|nr:sigma-70 family RNA polymerase sigma factor [Actinomarinicola tropica]
MDEGTCEEASLADDAFGRWYAESFAEVVGAVELTLGDPHLAADATAEAYARALERWSRVVDMANRDGWVYRVAVNDARNTIRRRLLERAWRDRQPPRAHVPELEPPDVELRTAIAQLSRRQREAIGLRYVAGMLEREVAEAMGITLGAASATLAAARRRLHETLGGGSW